MNQLLHFGSAMETKTTFKGKSNDANVAQSTRGSVEVLNVRTLTRKLLSCPVADKECWRNRVTNYLLKSQKPDMCIDEVLSFCTTQGGPDGLDVAIDILTGTGDLIVKYAWNFLVTDIINWEPCTERAYKPNDDYWYVLLRAVSRTKTPEEDRFLFIKCCSRAESRGILESVIEGLRDLRTEDAKTMLREFVKEGKDHYIRQLAQDALDDLES